MHADIVYKNKKFQLTGNQMTELGYDYLTVYAGTTNKGKKLLETSGCEEEWVDEPDGYSIYYPINIEPVICSSMLLHFYSDSGVNYAGLDLTVTIEAQLVAGEDNGEILADAERYQ